MFDKQYRFKGRHAYRADMLTNIIDPNTKFKVFNRNIDVYINPPMARENIEYWVRSIEKMIKSTHFCEVHYFANNTVFGSGLYSNEIKEITYYFSFFIE